MVQGVADSSNLLWVDGESVSLDFNRDSSTTGTLTWTIPESPKAYKGILITASLKEINPSNYPTDSAVYTASSDLSSPNDLIGTAQVVVALYNDITTITTTVTGLDPNQVYFFSAHVISNVNTYYTIGVRSYPESQLLTPYAGDIQKSYGPPSNPVIGQPYYDENQKLVFFWDGSAWTPTSSHTVLTGNYDPVSPFTGLPDNYPELGDFFYNIIQKSLKIWNGSAWNDAESVNGVPIYQKQGVGTDLTFNARNNLIDIIKKQLGYPKVCVELIEDHFNIAINNALMEYRRRVDSAYNKQYFFMNIVKFQQLFYLNDPVFQTDKIVDILRIHRLNLLGLVNFAPDNIYAQQFLNQFYAPGVQYDLVSIHLIHAMSETYSLLFAGEIAFNWREPQRELYIYRKFSSEERVLLETSCERLEEEILVDRWAQQWIQQWAMSECYSILANIRGKYSTLPGPGGSLQLNADSCRAEADRLRLDCLRQVKDFEVGNNGSNGFYMPFVIG